MDTDVFRFCIGLVIASWGIAYAWWVKVRVYRLRDDLFAIRDNLFDEAASLDAFEDEGYRATRATINACIQAAGTLSIPMLVCAYVDASELPPFQRPRSDNEKLDAAIGPAMDAFHNRVMRYVVYETGWGRVLWLVSRFAPTEARTREARRTIARCTQPKIVSQWAGAGSPVT